MIMNDCGNELLGHALNCFLIEKEYGVKAKCATLENPQAKSKLEQNLQVLANFLHTFFSKIVT